MIDAGFDMSFFEEMKRRNVVRVGLAYIVAAWLVIQVVETIFPAFGFGDSAVRIVVVILAIGLVPALILAWLFELTPQGLKREFEVDRSQSITAHTGRTLDRAIIVVLTLAVVYFSIEKFVVDSELNVGNDKSIAVLPFSNRSAQAEDAFFVDGIHDDILTQLANLSGLDKVISRTSMEQYRDTKKSVLQIGQELGVATILEGGVQRAGNRVRINMQLIKVETDEHLWAATFDRELTVENIFDIQGDISREIAGALQATFSEQDDKRLQTAPTSSFEAYGEYVLGRQQLDRRTAGSLARAQLHFEKAIELDPVYALAYVGLADVLDLQSEYSGKNLRQTFSQRRTAIDKALEINPDSGEAYASLGNLRKQQGDLEGAESSFLKAIELSPNYVSAHHWYANLLREAGRDEAALVPIRRALEIDPAAPVLTAVLSATLTSLGRFEEAQGVLVQGIERMPEFPGFSGRMSTLFMRMGQLGKSAVWAQRAIQLNESNFHYRTIECRVLIDLDEADLAEACLDQLRQSFNEFPEKAFARVAVPLYQSQGQSQAAVDYMEAVVRKDPDQTAKLLLANTYLLNGQWRKAQSIYELLAPGFYGDAELIVDYTGIVMAINAAATLRHGGNRKERAFYLAGQALETMRSMNRVQIWESAHGIGYAFWDVLAHGIRGENEKALAAMRETIDSGWRIEWWVLRLPVFEMLRSEPEWETLVAELESDVAGQRRWFQANRSKLLH